MPIYRYRFNAVSQGSLERIVPGTTFSGSGPNVEVDLDQPDPDAKPDLDLYMESLGWAFIAEDPTTSLPGQQAGTLSANTTLPATGGVFPVDTSGGDVTLTLPPLASSTGEIMVKNIGPGIVTIQPDGAEQIDGQPNLELTNPMEAAALCSGTASSWWIF